MKPIDERELKIIAQVQVLQTMLTFVCKHLRQASPEFERLFREIPPNMFELLSLRGHPEASDLLTAELQEAWARLREQIISA